MVFFLISQSNPKIMKSLAIALLIIFDFAMFSIMTELAIRPDIQLPGKTGLILLLFVATVLINVGSWKEIQKRL